MEACFEPVTERIDALLASGSSVLAAIDGNCTAGKTTLAALLAERYDCNVFHMDDFFLRPEQRTPERLAEAGGNVDYERFCEEVLDPLLKHREFSYRPYDCGTQSLAAPVFVPRKKLNIIEGTYALHPSFGEVYNLTVFLSVSSQTQRERILQRPRRLHRRFFEEWIPMEQAYFDSYGIPARCDICL